MNPVHRAYVLPAHVIEPGRVVGWSDPGEFLPLIDREIGCEYPDHGRVVYPAGKAVIWVNDEGLVNGSTPEYNTRALTLARAGGWPAGAIAGTVLITGGDGANGEPLGLSEPLLAWIDTAVRAEKRATP